MLIHGALAAVDYTRGISKSKVILLMIALRINNGFYRISIGLRSVVLSAFWWSSLTFQQSAAWTFCLGWVASTGYHSDLIIRHICIQCFYTSDLQIGQIKIIVCSIHFLTYFVYVDYAFRWKYILLTWAIRQNIYSGGRLMQLSLYLLKLNVVLLSHLVNYCFLII